MKKNFLMMALVSLFTVVAISSCSKDDDDDKGDGIGNTITATVENGSSLNGKIDVVKAEIYLDDDGGVYVAASAPYTNGGFTLTLPETVSDTYLDSLDGVPASITVSNRNVKIVLTSIVAYKADEETGEFYHGIADCWGSLIYSNGDVSVTGTATETYTYDSNDDGVDETYTYTEKYNVHLKRGWNIMYEKEIEKGNNTREYEYTTTVPSGANWYYDDF